MPIEDLSIYWIIRDSNKIEIEKNQWLTTNLDVEREYNW